MSFKYLSLSCGFQFLLHIKVTVSVFVCVCVYTQADPTLCDPMNCSPPGSSVHGIFQARILEWVAISSSWESSRPRDWIYVSHVSCIGKQILHLCTTWEALLKSLPPQAPSTTTPSKLTTLGASLVGPCSAVLRRSVMSDSLRPMDCSPPGSSVHGIFLERTLDWVAISFSTGSSQPRDWTRVSYVFCIAKWILYH